jgi:hypothetical protein
MAGTQFTALCKTKPLGEHEGPDEKIISDGDNGGMLLVCFYLSALLIWDKVCTHTSFSHHQNDIQTVSLPSHHLVILEPSFLDRSTVAVFHCQRTLAS